MTNTQYREQIIDTLADMGQIEADRKTSLLATADSDLSFVEMEMDSLTALDFCVSLEEKTQRTIEPADLVDHPSVNALARHLATNAPAI